MTSSTRFKLLLMALSPLVVWPLAEWISTTRIGTRLPLELMIIYLIPLLIALPAVPLLLLCLLHIDGRRYARDYLPLIVLFIPSCLGGLFLGGKVRIAGMSALADRSRPLVRAISRYERDHRAPPTSLDELVPEYLPAVPATGMMAYPKYEYYTDAKNWDDNPWVLAVFTPSGGINFDRMLYFPKQNYPRHGYGGGIERVRDWAYVHE